MAKPTAMPARPERAVIENKSRPLRQPLQVKYCQTFLSRLRGLTFRRHLAPTDGILLVQGRASVLDAGIHMFFMWMPIAVVWISQAGRVVDVQLARPWRPAYLPKEPAIAVLETAAGRFEEFLIGDEITITPYRLA